MPEDQALENGAAQDVEIGFTRQRIRIVSGFATPPGICRLCWVGC